MKGIKRIEEAQGNMKVEEIILALLEEAIKRDVDPWKALQEFIPRLKAILAEQEKAAKGSDAPKTANGMPYEEHTNKKL
jgi:hypothetical protein